jgi:hypothetical protein
VLDVLFPLDSVANIGIALVIDEFLNAVATRVIAAVALPVLPNPPGQVVCDPT